MNPPGPWLTFTIDTVGAFGSAGAAIAAVWLASRDRKELARIRATEKLRQARRVTSGVSITPEFDGVRWTVNVSNGAEAQLYDVAVEVWSKNDPTFTGRAEIGQMAPRSMQFRELPGIPPAAAAATPGHRLRFRDANDVEWVREDDGTLAEVNRAGRRV